MRNSKTPQCRIFWFLVITISLTLTAVSLYEAAHNFISEPFHVALSRQKMDNILYPPLKVCFDNWMSWINWTSADAANFTKHETLFGMSFLTDVFSEEIFDENEIEKSFISKLLANKMSVEQFYVSMAKRNIKMIEDVPDIDEDQGFQILLEDRSDNAAKVPIKYWLCYQFSEARVLSLIQHMKSNEYVNQTSADGIHLKLNFSEFVIRRSRMPELFTEYEYNAQLFAYALSAEFFDFGADTFSSVTVYPDAYSKNFIGIGELPRYAMLKMKAFSWTENDAVPCAKGHRWITSNKTCLKNCKKNFEIQLRESVLKKNFSNVIHTPRNKIFFGKFDRPEIEVMWKSVKDADFKGVNDKNQTEKAQIQYEECKKNCSLEIGCEEWSCSFTSNYMAAVATPAIIVSYPTNVAVMNEVNLQTWENFTSNIGGLLGIWTGASVLTIFQIIYLCFWNDGAADEHTDNSRRKDIDISPPQGQRMKETIFSSQVPPPDELFAPDPF